MLPKLTEKFPLGLVGRCRDVAFVRDDGSSECLLPQQPFAELRVFASRVSNEPSGLVFTSTTTQMADEAPALGSHGEFFHQPAGRGEDEDPNEPCGGTAPTNRHRRGGDAELPQHPLDATMKHGQQHSDKKKKKSPMVADPVAVGGT